MPETPTPEDTTSRAPDPKAKARSPVGRVLAIVGILAALGLLGAGVVTVMLKRSAERWVEGMTNMAPRIQTEAVEFAVDKDQDACLDEALRRGPGSCTDLDVTCSVEAALFLHACLPEALPVMATCEGVPQATEFVDAAAVLAERCADRGYSNRQACTQILQNGLLRYCDEIRPAP